MLLLLLSSSLCCGASGTPLTADFVVFDAIHTPLVEFRRAALSSKRLLPFDDIRKLVVNMLDGALYLADNGVVHMDMKLESMALDSTGRLLLADLGEAVVTVRASVSLSVNLHALVVVVVGGGGRAALTLAPLHKPLW